MKFQRQYLKETSLQDHIARLDYITREIEEAAIARNLALRRAADATHLANEREGRIRDLTLEKKHLEALIAASSQAVA